MSSVPHVYRYPAPSSVRETPTGRRVELLTSGGVVERTHFLEGRVIAPRRVAALLEGVADVAGERFHRADLARLVLDPVVTSDGERLRFESFSQCCSVHARVDLLPDAVEGDVRGRGTTNVDFNAPMRAALARVRDGERMALKVGRDEVAVERDSESVVERKVRLPSRWLKGFGEIPSYQARLVPRLEVPAADARRFLRSLPRTRGGSGDAAYVTPAGAGLRLTHRATADAVPVGALDRLRVLDGLLAHASMLRISEVPGEDVTSWDLVLDDARFCLLLSASPARGFSGEGQALSALVRDDWRDLAARVRAALKWRGRILAADVAADLDEDVARVEAALTGLGARGLVGFDAEQGAYFHRELPFALDAVERMQPRLKDARELAAGDAVELVRREGRVVEAFVRSGPTEYLVRFLPDGARCNCPWYARHAGARGPCKHVLAATLAAQEDSRE